MTGVQKRNGAWWGIVIATAVFGEMLCIPIQPTRATADQDRTLLAMALFGRQDQKAPAPPSPASPKPPEVPVKPVPSPNAPVGSGTTPAQAPSPLVVPGTIPKSAVPGAVPTPAMPAGTGQSLPAPTPDPAPDAYSYDPKSRREPFQSMVQMIKTAKAQSEMPPLQRFEISDIKLVGVIWGGYGYYGLIQTPDGKGYTVKEGMLMGTKNGTIKSISATRILVSEPTIEVTGKKSTRESEILLRSKEGTQ